MVFTSMHYSRFYERILDQFHPGTVPDIMQSGEDTRYDRAELHVLANHCISD